jgi:hypothetical protein
LLVDERIQIVPGDTGGPVLIGECHRCGRFVCSRHGEPLDLSGKKRWPWQKASALTIGCPFDPGVPLGRAG